jgi:ATP-dependent Clp protease protease subunit
MEEHSEKCGGEIWVTKFDEEHAQKFREAVISQAKQGRSNPIVVYIDSYGGEVDALAKMIETLDEVPNPIVTVTLGKAMSCGAILFSHGDMRFCGKHSRIMVHEVSGGAFGNVHDLMSNVEEAKRVNHHFIGLLAKNCGYKSYTELRKVIKEKDGKDLFMNADEAVKFGIADMVGLPRINLLSMFEINLVAPKQDIIQRSKTKKTKKKSETNK